MQLKNLFADEDAVSPVIGVILMVAITVILAAVIGAFVLGIGGSQEAAPQASIAFDWGSSDVTFSHDGGETMQASQLSVTGGGGIGSCSITASNGISAGNQIGECTTLGSSGDEVTITWEASSGDSSNIIGQSTQP